MELVSWTRPPARPIGEILRGKHLLVTGVTGFVGKVWLSHLLAHVPEIGRISVIVRGSRTKSAADRLAKMLDTSPVMRPLREKLDGDWQAFLDARIEVLDGDVTRKGCGLSDAVIGELAQSVDCVVHIAGLTDFQPDPKKGIPANVDGAVHVGELTARLRCRRLVHTSTCYVAGHADGLVEERLQTGVSPRGRPFDPAAEVEQAKALIRSIADAQARIDAVQERATNLGWPNLYTYTKGLSEHLLAAMDLDVTIVRPSVVECAQTWPFPGWNEGLNTSAPIMWFCGTPFSALPSRGHHVFDIIPVDAVARWLTVAITRAIDGDAHRVYQLGTSDINPTTFERIVELTALGKRRHAGRHGGRAAERLVSHLDVRAKSKERIVGWTPAHVESALGRIRAWFDRLEHRAPARLHGRMKDLLRSPRKHVVRQQRAMAQLERMLDVYQPFIHDHSWTFRTDHIRDEMSRLHAEDAPFFDDLARLDWRKYWLDVQYPGVVRWSFPLVDNREAPLDPPSVPPLALGRSRRLAGAA